MNAKLLTATIVIVIVAYVMSQKRPSGGGSEIKKLSEVIKVPTLQGIDLENIEGEKTQLKDAGGGKWVVASRHDYPADLKKIADLIGDLTNTRVLHRTKGASNHERLGLIDPTTQPKDAPKAGEDKKEEPKDEHGHGPGDGHDHGDEDKKDPEKKKLANQVTFHTKDGAKRLLLANSEAEQDRGGLSSSQGMNVRFADQPDIFRLGKSVWIAFDTTSWLEKEVVSIEGDLVRSVHIGPGSTSPVKISRREKGDGWELEEANPDEKVNTSEARGVSGALASLRLNDVLPRKVAEEKSVLTTSTTIIFDLFDGRTYDVTMGDKVTDGDKEHYYASLSVSLSDKSTDTALKERVQKEQEKFKPWVFDVGSWIRSGVVKQRADFIEKPEPASPSPGAPPVEGGAEEIKARHILISFKGASGPGGTRTKEEAKALATDIRARIEAGESFVTLAKEFSEDSSNKEKGGDLGSFGRGQMVKPFEEAAWALLWGQISEPVETDFGYHLIQRLE